MRTELGKIKKLHVGFGGYQEAQFGVTIELGGDNWGVQTFKGHWGIKHVESCQWTEADQLKGFGEAMDYLRGLLKDAHKTTADQLIGIPIEATFDGTMLQDFRILTEVL